MNCNCANPASVMTRPAETEKRVILCAGGPQPSMGVLLASAWAVVGSLFIGGAPQSRDQL